MATPDGINDRDWDVVHELAVEIVDASLAEDDERETSARARLLGYLDRLETKYGERPSILATRADFIDDLQQKRELLARAYALARARGDRRNQLYVAHSLAELYVEDLGDAAEARRWLFRLREHLIEVEDAHYAEEYARLRAELDSTL